jgi:hypothetical protein
MSSKRQLQYRSDEASPRAKKAEERKVSRICIKLFDESVWIIGDINLARSCTRQLWIDGDAKSQTLAAVDNLVIHHVTPVCISWA